MRPHPRIRRTIKWGGGAIVLLLVAAWVVGSRYTFTWMHRVGLMAAAPHGRLILAVGNSGEWTPWFGHLRSGANASAMQAYWDRRVDEAPLKINTPLWIPVGATTLFSAAAWLLDAAARRRMRPCLCRECMYDRTGLAAGAVCPECGTPPPAASSS